MIRQIPFYLFWALFAVQPIYAQEVPEVTTEDYSHAVRFLGNNTRDLVTRDRVRPEWLDDGRFWYRIRTDKGWEYVLYDPDKKTRKVAGSKAELFGDVGYEETPEIDDSEVLSPDGTKVAFLRDWNLWMRDLRSGKEIALTTDGVMDFGYATDNAGWRKSDRPVLLWSPDSKKIATYKQDQRHVDNMYLVETTVGAPTLQQWKYPLPGDEKPIMIERVIIDVEKQQVIPLKIPPDPRRGTLCDDISCSGAFDDNMWDKTSTKLAFVSTSRDHKEARLRIADAKTGVVREVFQEKVPTQYESGQGSINWRYLPESDEIIWYSERDNWGHLYLYDLENGELKHQITEGDFVVTKLLRVDQDKRVLYFLAQGKEAERNPYYAHLYRVDFDGKNLEILTPEDANHNVFLSPEGNYFVDSYSTPVSPPVAVVRSTNGTLIEGLEEADISGLIAQGWQPPQEIQVKSANGNWDLYGLMFTPTSLDPEKEYPVVNYIYPGPQGGSVGSWNFMASRRDHQALAELGFIVVLIDGTCNPGRSKKFHDACYGDISTNTLEDQISGLRQLAARHDYLDLTRVGIWGHSGGGFATAAAMFRYPEFYKVGIAESGNHDNRNYEDDWGERYIGLLQRDQAGFSNYTLQANQLHAENLQGKLLLAHGGLDDNVPPYNTFLVVDALIDANKDFDLIIFPNARHGFGQDSDYMTRRRWDYFVRHLLGSDPPDNFQIGSQR